MSSWKAPDVGARPVVVLGGGVLGRRIACVWAAGGYNVHIRDPSEEQRNQALHYIDNNVEDYSKATGAKPGKYDVYEDLEAAVKDAWLVIEAIPEKLSLKIDTFEQLFKATSDDCCLCSNSSSYKSSLMLEKVDPSQQHRILNLHYYMPPDNRLVELMTDGKTDPKIFDFLVEHHKKVGMHPVVAMKESTGFVFNRIWAAIKREVTQVLLEGVSTPEQIDSIWSETFSGAGAAGPCAMMDAVGLDTVANIEDNYIKERGLGSQTVEYLRKNYIDQGKLGAKSGKGGLYPAGATTKTKGEDSSHHDNLHAPTLYFLDLASEMFPDPTKAASSGRVLCGSVDGKPLRVLAERQRMPDGLDISFTTGRLYWTNMGIPSANDGHVVSCKLDGSDLKTIVQEGQVHTPKQLVIDQKNNKLYFCDREGLRVMRCNLDGSSLETLVQRGDWQSKNDAEDQTNWCVGVSVDAENGHLYWTQKGPSKGSKGRIFRAGLEIPPGKDASNRDDIETLFSSLPECIDLEIDPQTSLLYWSDRGELPLGNSVNRAYVGKDREAYLKDASGLEQKLGYRILASQLHEAIGVKLDKVNQHIYVTDLGGTVYQYDIEGGNKKKVYEDQGAFTGIGLTHS